MKYREKSGGAGGKKTSGDFKSRGGAVGPQARGKTKHHGNTSKAPNKSGAK